MKTFQTIKSRKQAATEIHECMKGYEGELALAYSTIYRAIRYDATNNSWQYQARYNTNHYNYTA